MTTSLSASNDIAGKSVLPAAGKYLSQTALICLVYFVAGRLGLAVPYASGNVSPVWPASGVALSALLLLGYRVWPGIALGALLVNLFSPIPHIAAAGLAVGNTLAAVTGAFLLRRMPAFRALRKNLMGPAILAGLVFRGKRYPRPSWLGKCGNPASVAGFPSAAGTVEKSGLNFSTVPTACHFHSQALDSGPFWLECRPWAQQGVLFLIFHDARQLHIFPDSCGEPFLSWLSVFSFCGRVPRFHRKFRVRIG